MYSRATIKIKGYRDQTVPNTFWRQKQQADQIGVILPGRGYTTNMPLLFYATKLLLAHGADVLTVDYEYFSDPSFREISEAERSVWIGSDVAAAVQAGLAQGHYSRSAFVAKSLGTLALGYLLGDPSLSHAQAIWLTPLLGSETLRQQIHAWGGYSLFVIGSADEAYQSEHLAAAQLDTNSNALVLDGADHALEVPGDIWRSLDYLQQTVRAMDIFLGAKRNVTK